MTDRTIAYVGCGAAKQDTAAAAGDLYTSTYFAKKRAFAETVCDDWLILSAKFGLLSPGRLIAPYDVTMTDYPLDNPDYFPTIDAWATEVIAHTEAVIELARLNPKLDSLTFYLLAGKAYLSPIRDDLERLADEYEFVTIEAPFDDTSGIGDQMAWLKTETQEATV